MFTKSFLLTALENSVTTGLATFAASGVFTSTPSVKGLIAGAVAAGMAALYSFVKNLGSVQATKALAAGSAK